MRRPTPRRSWSCRRYDLQDRVSVYRLLLVAHIKLTYSLSRFLTFNLSNTGAPLRSTILGGGRPHGPKDRSTGPHVHGFGQAGRLSGDVRWTARTA